MNLKEMEEEIRLFNYHVDHIHVDSVKSFLDNGYDHGIYKYVYQSIIEEAALEKKTLFEKIVHPLLNMLPYTKVVNRQPFSEMLDLLEKSTVAILPEVRK